MTQHQEANSAEPAEVCAREVFADAIRANYGTIAADETIGEYGTFRAEGNCLIVYGDHGQLYGWAHRPGHSWPCSELATLSTIAAWLDGETGDLLDLSLSSDHDYVSSDELTAWIDDNLAGTPFAHLARNPEATS